MASYHSRIERKLYAAIAAGKFNPGAFKKEFCEAHNLISRQFNSMALEVKGKIAGTMESLIEHVAVLSYRVKTIKGAVYNLSRIVQTGLDAKGRVVGKKRLEVKERNFYEKKRKIDNSINRRT